MSETRAETLERLWETGRFLETLERPAAEDAAERRATLERLWETGRFLETLENA